METTSLINLMPSTKSEMLLFVEKTVNMVNAGEVNPLELSVKLKVIEETIGKIRKEIADKATDEAIKYGKSFEKNGCKVEVANVGVKYDFTNCNDALWSEIDKSIKDATEEKKKRETFLKSLDKPFNYVDDTTGEIRLINPPIKTGKESVKITIK
jgi:hypothetical protein